ncbi:hypothetical protein CON48_21725 [Bacillus thuringiensis]|uniref:Uncharacterized protein n=3 Tax=Bacillus cereus group TaxID=86661 RepID=A0A9X6VD74_BACTU|nr:MULTISPECIES: hypothetical protein [Bacillus]AJQ59955.1 hypothetical protein SD98_17225 [Bacillus thuringiensis serovar morrisoni]AMR85747.1 hypothetical protein A3L20_17535 [Bacillus thuringiensis]AZV67152.1 hypothetical protein DT426_16330 [Bacillus cereus]EJP91132.1 hypothetical protein IC1_01687 [Bacillus cereus VD022]EOO08863.1 hypothetical protein IAW_01657 [Bacillus cereus str. Schrouff]
MKQIYIISGVLLISLLTIYILFNTSIIQPHPLSIENKREQQTNTISYGLKDNQGQHINNGSTITSEDNKINVTLSFVHTINENRKYGLIVLEDYEQKPFKIEDTTNEISHYFFDMKPNSSITTKISLHTSPNANELTFLIIKKPEYKLKDNNLNKAAILEDILSMRYSMHPLQKENEKIKLSLIDPDAILKDGLYEPLFVTNREENLQTVFFEKEGKQLTLSNGNETNDEMTYAIVAFKDWKQVEIFNNRKVVYTKVAPETRQIFNFTLPSVDQESNFQLVAFPFPFKVSEEDYISQQAFSSFRIVIENDNK